MNWQGVQCGGQSHSLVLLLPKWGWELQSSLLQESWPHHPSPSSHFHFTSPMFCLHCSCHCPLHRKHGMQFLSHVTICHPWMGAPNWSVGSWPQKWVEKKLNSFSICTAFRNPHKWLWMSLNLFNPHVLHSPKALHNHPTQCSWLFCSLMCQVNGQVKSAKMKFFQSCWWADGSVWLFCPCAIPLFWVPDEDWESRLEPAQLAGVFFLLQISIVFSCDCHNPASISMHSFWNFKKHHDSSALTFPFLQGSSAHPCALSCDHSSLTNNLVFLSFSLSCSFNSSHHFTPLLPLSHSIPESWCLHPLPFHKVTGPCNDLFLPQITPHFTSFSTVFIASCIDHFWMTFSFLSHFNCLLHHPLP